MMGHWSWRRELHLMEMSTISNTCSLSTVEVAHLMVQKLMSQWAQCRAVLPLWLMGKIFFPYWKCNKRHIFQTINKSQMNITHLWLLQTAAYRLVSAYPELQKLPDAGFIQLWLRQLLGIPQLFYKGERDQLILTAAQIVDDMLQDLVKRPSHLLRILIRF